MTRQCAELFRQNREKKYGLKLLTLPDGAKHEVGKKYFCGYWEETYEVLDYKETNDWMGFVVTVRWQDGCVISHCTELREIDFMVIG